MSQDRVSRLSITITSILIQDNANRISVGVVVAQYKKVTTIALIHVSKDSLKGPKSKYVYYHVYFYFSTAAQDPSSLF